MAARKTATKKTAEDYKHDAEAVLRPEAGTQAQFRRNKPPKTYKYDSSLSPSLQWAGKAEHAAFDVPTLPLFVHERLSTKAILETLKGHERDQQAELQLFGDPQLSLAQQLEAYEHQGGWVNRLILGDSLVVMNSLLEYEGLGGQVQMVYIDPPYGVKFGSNFQPFVRKRDVKDGDDESLTREPEMVKAYRDTWELGVHSYLTYLRDRLVVARELLAESGSVFVQIGDDNVHHVRELLDEVFGAENFRSIIAFKKTAGLGTDSLPGVTDYLLWYARDLGHLKARSIFTRQDFADDPNYTWLLLEDGTVRRIANTERTGDIPDGAKLFRHQIFLAAGRTESCIYDLEFEGETFRPTAGRSWSTNLEGARRLIEAGRLAKVGRSLNYIRFASDFPYIPMSNFWPDGASGVGMQKSYVVQTNVKIIQRCMLMATEPGDLVLDPTCGSGTTAYVAEQWGRRWITVDVSRVPLALARQRLLTATFPYYELRDRERGPSAGFIHERRQNNKGEEVGGIVPHVTLRSVANNERPAEEVLVDRPEVNSKVTRVTGPFAVEATIPTPLEDGESQYESGDGSFAERMIEILRRDPVLHLGDGKLALKDIRPPAKSLTLSAEAVLDGDDSLLALLFGPENGAVSEKAVFEAAKEANARSYARLVVVGFAIEAGARELVEKAESLVGIPATYVQATPDLVMADLLKTMRSSQLFSVTGLPDVQIKSVPPESKGDPGRYQVELRGLDVFDPTTMESVHRSGDDVPAWLLDTDYNDLSFHVSQAFFPRTGAWESLKRALKGEFADTVWDHLAGTTSTPFVAGENRKVAVKVIDDRGNELMLVRDLE